MSNDFPILCTIGYEGLVQEQLLDLVQAAGVSLVLDVRAVPLSRKAGFSKTILAGSLQARGLAYLNDRRLGTPKPGRDAARRGKSGTMAAIFEAHLQTPEASAALEDAIMCAQRETICLLCFERDPHACHRHIVAQRIRARTGQMIRHL